jgi:hypothetical protein
LRSINLRAACELIRGGVGPAPDLLIIIHYDDNSCCLDLVNQNDWTSPPKGFNAAGTAFSVALLSKPWVWPAPGPGIGTRHPASPSTWT